MLSKKVLVQNINNLSEARYCSGMMVDYLSFPLNEEIITPKQFEEVKGWLSGVKIYGEVNSPENALKLSELYSIDKLILNEFLPIELNIAININSSDVEAFNKIEQYKNKVDFIIYNTKSKLEESDHEILKNFHTSSCEILISANYAFQDFQDYAERTYISGFVFKGGKEERPGFNNFDYLAERLEFLELS